MTTPVKKLTPQTIIPPALYVLRHADRQLHQVIADMGRPGYVLVARQMGKTNLLLNAKRACQGDLDVFAYIDLSKPFESPRECFRYITDTIVESLPTTLQAAGEVLIAKRSEKRPPYKEHEAELRHLLSLIKGKLVVSIDEIDSLTNTSFSDQVFAQIRSVYFTRVNMPEFSRLTYILSGVVDPNDIIKDKRISPFNIGEKIYLDDFSVAEFADFLNRSDLRLPGEVAERIYYWTEGNPRMTWDVCSRVEDVIAAGRAPTMHSVDEVVADLYLKDFNRAPVDHIRELVAAGGELRTAVRSLHRGNTELSDDLRNKLYLAGISASIARGGQPRLKNPIIAATLSEAWLNEVAVKRKGLLKAAQERYEEHHYDEALSLFQQYLRERTMTAEEALLVYYQTAYCFYYLGRYEEAIPFFDKAALNAVDEARLFYQKQLLLGVCYYQLRDYQRSIEYFSRVAEANRRDANHARALLNLGSAYTHEATDDSIAKAVRTYEQAIALCTDQTRQMSQEDARSSTCLAYYNIGSLLSDSGKSQAVAALNQAESIANGSEKPLILLSLAQLHQDNDTRKQLLAEICSLVTKQHLAPELPHPEMPLRVRPDAYVSILKEVFTVDRGAFSSLVAHLLTCPNPLAESEPELYYIVAAHAANSGDRQTSIQLLKKVLAIEGVPDTRLYWTYRLLSLVSGDKEAGFYFAEYFRLLDAQGVSTHLWFADFRVFERAIYHAIQTAAFELARRWIAVVKRFIPHVDSQLLSNYAGIYWLEIHLYDLMGRNKVALDLCKRLLSFIDTLPSDVEAQSLLDKQQLEEIKTAARRRVEAVAPRGVPVKADPKIGRNDKVTVRYSDGRIVRDVKYKRVSEEVEQGRCVVVKQT